MNSRLVFLSFVLCLPLGAFGMIEPSLEGFFEGLQGVDARESNQLPGILKQSNSASITAKKKVSWSDYCDVYEVEILIYGDQEETCKYVDLAVDLDYEEQLKKADVEYRTGLNKLIAKACYSTCVKKSCFPLDSLGNSFKGMKDKTLQDSSAQDCLDEAIGHVEALREVMISTQSSIGFDFFPFLPKKTLVLPELPSFNEFDYEAEFLDQLDAISRVVEDLNSFKESVSNNLKEVVQSEEPWCGKKEAILKKVIRKVDIALFMLQGNSLELEDTVDLPSDEKTISAGQSSPSFAREEALIEGEAFEELFNDAMGRRDKAILELLKTCIVQGSGEDKRVDVALAGLKLAETK